MKPNGYNFAREARFAKLLCGDLSEAALESLEGLIRRHKVSLVEGDVKYLNGGWYVNVAPAGAWHRRYQCGIAERGEHCGHGCNQVSQWNPSPNPRLRTLHHKWQDVHADSNHGSYRRGHKAKQADLPSQMRLVFP